jgi:hypothetical protein
MQTQYYTSALVVAAIVCAHIVSGCSPPLITAPQSDLDIGTPEWYEEIERRLTVSARSGNSVEVGSTQWLETVSSLIAVYDHEGHGPDLDSDEWQRCVHGRLFGKLALPDSAAETNGGVK